jgi:hypothetical protein
MPKSIYVPAAGSVIDFPDEASNAEIVAYVDKVYGRGSTPAAPPSGPDESTLLGRAAYGFATGITEIPGGIAALVMPAEQAAASSLGQISEQSRKYLQETFGIDPTKDPTAAQQAAEALGSVGSFLIPATGVAKVASLAGRGARAAGALGEIAAAEKAARIATRAGTATAAAQGVALGAGQRAETIRGQLASGMEISPETQLASQQLSGLIGSLEAAPLERFFGPLTQLLSKVPASKAPVVEKIVKSRLAKITKAGLAEGAQEAASGIANDLMEYGVYNPDVQIGQDLLSSAGTGAFAGSFVEGLVQLAAGRRLRPYRQLQKDLAAEKQQNAIDARRGIISTAAEQLRQYNVEGPVEVIQDEVENVPIFSLKTRAGNIIGEFADRNAVTEALDIYKAKTGAKVDVIEAAEAPSIFPVKIGRQQYKSADEIKASRDRIATEIEKSKLYISTPEFTQIGATQNKVSPEEFTKQTSKRIEGLEKQLKPLDEFITGTTAAPIITQPAPEVPAPEVTAPEATPAPTLETPPEAITDVPEAVSVEPVSPIGMAEEAAVEAPEAVIEAPEAPPTVGSVPFMMTNKIRSDLRGRGYTEEQIFNMRPEEAQDILSRPPEAPPEQLSAGPLPEVAPTPKTVREVTAEVTAPRDYTPEQKAFDERVFTGLKSRLSTLNLPGIEPVLREMIDKKPGYLVRGFVDAKGTPNDMKIILELSKGILDPRLTVEQNIEALTEVMNHEIIHVVRRMGLFRPAEWNILSKAVKNTKVPGKSYTYLDKAQAVYEPMGGVYADPEAVLEEAVAEMYKDWVSGKSKPVQNATGLLNRLREFFRRIFGVLKSDAQTQVFRRIESGEVGSREAAPVVETQVDEGAAEPTIKTDVRVSAAPLPANLEAMNEKLYAPAPQKSFKDMVFDFFLSETPTDRVFKSPLYGDVKIGKWTRAGLIGRAAAVDKNTVIDHLEKMESEIKGKGFELESADYSSLFALEMKDRASHLAVDLAYKGIMYIEKDQSGDILSSTIKTRESPDNLGNVFSVMLEPGQINPETGQQEDKRKIWRLYATAKRAIGLKAEGKRVPAELTDAAVRETISFTETNYPEIVEAYKMYQRFNKRLLEAAVEAEVISQQELADLTKRMDYYSYYYEVFEEVKGPNISTKTASRFNLRPYKGTELGGLVNDPMYVMLTNMNFWVSAIAKNIATRKSFELAKRMGVARALGTGEDPDRTRGEEDQVMFYRDKGVERRFAVSDPLLVTALGSDDRVNVGRFWEVMGLPTGWLRESITRDPGFMVANLMRDTVAAWITSGADILPFIGTVKGFANAYSNGASFQALQSRGIVGSYDRAMIGPRELAARIRRDKMPKNIHMITSSQALVAATSTIWNRLGALSEMSDAATRIAVFDAARAKGLSEAEASWQALRIMNFSRHGASQTLSILTKLVPFLNARIQGLDVLYQAGQAGVRVAIGKARSESEANLGKKFLIRGGMLAAISMALEMINEDDEDYQQIEDYVKNANLLIPLSGFGLKGEFIAVPKAFEAGLLFSTFPQQFYKSMTGEASTRENVALFTSSFASTFGITPIPQFMLPALEVIVNHDFYTGLPLISEGQARLAPELQYNARTSQLAMMISGVPIFYDMTTGRFEGASPIVIDNLIGGYAGPFGTYISQAASLAMENFDVGPERLPRSLSEMPVVRRFFIDTEDRNPKVVSQAYELFRVVDEANRSFSRLKQIGDAEAVKDYLDENRDVLSYRKYVFRLVEGLNKLAARERQIAADQEMTRDEKFEAMRKLRETRLNLASKVSEINEKIGR